MQTYFPGTRVVVFDSLLYKDDKTTPLNHTMRPATVVCWYSLISQQGGYYPNCVDVRFDHRSEKISKGHFADNIEVLSTPSHLGGFIEPKRL